MRIISGKYRGKQIVAPGNLPVRPTTDFAKEGLFNLLENQMDLSASDALDLFAGTGNISFELLSRGVKSLQIVDNNHACIRFIQQTLEKLGEKKVLSFRTDVFIALPRFKNKFDLIFADPPYDYAHYERLVDEVFKFERLKPNGIFVLEHPKEQQFSQHPYFIQHRHYGKVNFSFFIFPA